MAEAEALAAAAEASGDASLGSDFGLSEYLVDGGSQDYEFQTDFMGDPTRISKKKRKKIFKSSNASRRMEGIGVQGVTLFLFRFEASAVDVTLFVVAIRVILRKCGRWSLWVESMSM